MIEPYFNASSHASEAKTIDQGLREHMVRVFNYMSGGLALTGLLAFVTANTALASLIFGTPLKWLAILAPFGIIFYMNFKMRSMTASRAQTLFWVFCGTMGLSLASIFLVFTGASVARAFFITAATFAGMSLWGYTTKKDLSSFGAFLGMGLLGLFIAMIVNLFMASTMLQWIVSIAGVAIFTGLTAYDVQNIKRSYSAGFGRETNTKMAVMSALQLYLNFINAFQFLLSLTGDRR